jgi:uncharacterized membrane protein YdjX (TVP38/TMEM64 family)
MGRFFLVLLILAVMVALPFALWGEWLERMMDQDRMLAWFREQESVGWLIAIGLLNLDIFLPIPSSAIMAALGLLYGPVLGGLLSSIGIIMAGGLGYGVARWLGRPLALRLTGGKTLAWGEAIFGQRGGWIVALSRWVPVLSEVVAIAAGLAGMPGRGFTIALICGAVPLGFAYAILGHLGADEPVWVFGACLVIPALLWGVAVFVFKFPDAAGRELGRPRSGEE